MRVAFLGLGLLLAGRALAFDAAEFEATMESMRAASHVPGIAVAVVKDDQILFEKGFGVRDAATGAPVTADTLFGIGSTSKAFTATALAQVAERSNAYGFRDRVKDHLPEFQLADPIATELTTTFDLLSHHTGLPRHDLVWYRSGVSRGDLLPRLKYLGSYFDFRERFLYNNLMFMVAGTLVERLSGVATWEDYVRTNITTPLGMPRTNFTIQALAADPDHAAGHAVGTDGAAHVIPYVDITNVAPAGAINSSVHEMTQWLRFHLCTGTLDGAPLLTSPTLAELHQPLVALPGSAQGTCLYCAPDVRYQSYGYAWVVMDYRGHTLVWHNGSIDGFLAWVGFVPDANVGVVALANSNHFDLPHVAAFTALDRALGLEPRDWLARAQTTSGDDAGCDGPDRAFPRPETDYVGVYEHPAYGRFTMAIVDGKLTAELGVLGASDVFAGDDGVLRMRGFPAGMCELKFATGEGDALQSVAIGLEPNAPDIAFTKTADVFERRGPVRRFRPGKKGLF